MNSKERVLTALNHAEPDRVPLNLAGTNVDIDRRLKEHFGLAANDHEGLCKALKLDFFWFNAPYKGPVLHKEVEGRNVQPEWGIRTRWIEHESGGYWDFCDFPLKDADLEMVEAWPMPNPDDYDYSFVVEKSKEYEDYCVIIGDPGQGDIINSSGMLRTMEQILMDLALDNEAGLMLFKRKSGIQLEVLRRTLEATKGKVDMLWMGEDLGTQNSPLISLDMYRKHLRPVHQQFVDLGKAYGIPVMIHSCGSSSWAYDDFIDMGIRVVDTLQPEAAKMDPAYLKSRYGEKLAFHGCISTAGPLAYGTVKEAVADLAKTLEIMKPGGGYVMCPTHAIQDNTPTENVLAVYEKALELGRY